MEGEGSTLYTVSLKANCLLVKQSIWSPDQHACNECSTALRNESWVPFLPCFLLTPVM